VSDENDEVFDEEELGEGFEEEIVDGDEVDVDVDVEGDDVENVADADEVLVEVAAVVDDDDEIDDADVELALDEVLAETVRRSTTPEDDDEAPGEIDPLGDQTETILPKQEDEFRCKSCRLLKKMSQLADKDKQLCRDCV
jgi:Domain of unknown function (DUF4193)